jgi:hypothetical protein
VAAPPEIAGVFSCVGIGRSPDLPVSADADRAQADDLVTLQALAGLGETLKNPPVPIIEPILGKKPFLGAVRVSAAQHAPQLLANIRVHPEKGFRCHHMAVVVSPAP